MQPRKDDSEFNTPREMLERATFLLCLTTLTAGILLLIAGCIGRNGWWLAWGLASLMVAGGTRAWLQRQGKFEQADAAFDDLRQGSAPPEVDRVAELVRLLREWEALERRRGSPGFDPWAVQAVRHDIRAMIEEDPALEGLFHDRRHAA